MHKQIGLGLFVVALASAPALAGDVYIIDNAAGEMPTAIQKDAFALASVPDMGEGKPNQGFSYATALELAGTGVQIAPRPRRSGRYGGDA